MAEASADSALSDQPIPKRGLAGAPLHTCPKPVARAGDMGEVGAVSQPEMVRATSDTRVSAIQGPNASDPFEHAYVRPPLSPLGGVLLSEVDAT
jgi:hypothetical protein